MPNLFYNLTLCATFTPMAINPNIDIIAQIIAEVLKAKPTDAFCQSIQQQYFERGGLSKKQLEGLQGKAQRIAGIPASKLATLEAIIKKKHVTHRSSISATMPEAIVDTTSLPLITDILHQYPSHKRVCLLKHLLEKNGTLSTSEKEELVKFHKILIKN